MVKTAVLTLALSMVACLKTGEAVRVAGSADSNECDRTVALPPGAKPLQAYFDELRADHQIIDTSTGFGGMAEAKQCTKKDVCLLMRQLDMDFFARARAGTLTDADYNEPPPKTWLAASRCESQKRGVNLVPVRDMASCKEQLSKSGQPLQNGTYIKKRASSTLPSGCVLKDGRAYMNTQNTDVEAGVSYSRDKHVVMQLCEIDRSLTESGAAYYSPYKLKQSMLDRKGHSTSCSFGTYAWLAKLHETKSPCAKILTYKTHSKFKSLEQALDLANQLEGKQNVEGAEKIRAYVESIRTKNVLIDTIANHWCPDVWTAAMAQESPAPGTCAVPRVMTWTAEGQMSNQQTKQNKKSEGRPLGQGSGARGLGHGRQ